MNGLNSEDPITRVTTEHLAVLGHSVRLEVGRQCVTLHTAASERRARLADSLYDHILDWRESSWVNPFDTRHESIQTSDAWFPHNSCGDGYSRYCFLLSSLL